jgi:hypothetical protein
MQERGFENPLNLEGGMSAWRGPVEKAGDG